MFQLVLILANGKLRFGQTLESEAQLQEFIRSHVRVKRRGAPSMNGATTTCVVLEEGEEVLRFAVTNHW